MEPPSQAKQPEGSGKHSLPLNQAEQASVEVHSQASQTAKKIQQRTQPQNLQHQAKSDPKVVPQKLPPKPKSDKSIQPLNPLLEVQKLSRLKKWKETDLNNFIKLLSTCPKPQTDKDKEVLLDAILKVQPEFLSRIVSHLINQDYLDFIERREKPKFSFISLVKSRLSDFLLSLIELDEDESKLFRELDSSFEQLKALFRKKLEIDMGKSKSNSDFSGGKSSKDLTVRQADTSEEDSNSQSPWKAFSRVDRVRLLSSYIICVNDLNWRSDSKIPYIYNTTELLIYVFLKYPDRDVTRETLPLLSQENAKHKLKILFEELQARSSEKQLKTIYDFERINFKLIQDLKWSNEQHQRKNDALSLANRQLEEQVRRAKTEQQEMSAQIEEYLQKIEKLEEDIRQQKEAYTRLQETSGIRASQNLNSRLSQISRQIKHECENLERGINKYITDENTKSKFMMLITRIISSVETAN